MKKTTKKTDTTETAYNFDLGKIKEITSSLPKMKADYEDTKKTYKNVLVALSHHKIALWCNTKTVFNEIYKGLPTDPENAMSAREVAQLTGINKMSFAGRSALNPHVNLGNKWGVVRKVKRKTPYYMLPCDEYGQPIDGAKVQCFMRKVNTYYVSENEEK